MFKQWLENHLPESFIAAFATLVGWLAHRAIGKVDAHEERLKSLERDSVTKEDIEDLRRSQNESLSRIESRTDEILLHLARQNDR